MKTYTITDLRDAAWENALDAMQDRMGRSGEAMTLEEIDSLEQAGADFNILFNECGEPV